MIAIRFLIADGFNAAVIHHELCEIYGLKVVSEER